MVNLRRNDFMRPEGALSGRARSGGAGRAEGSSRPAHAPPAAAAAAILPGGPGRRRRDSDSEPGSDSAGGMESGRVAARTETSAATGISAAKWPTNETSCK